MDHPLCLHIAFPVVRKDILTKTLVYRRQRYSFFLYHEWVMWIICIGRWEKPPTVWYHSTMIPICYPSGTMPTRFSKARPQIARERWDGVTDSSCIWSAKGKAKRRTTWRHLKMPMTKSHRNARSLWTSHLGNPLETMNTEIGCYSVKRRASVYWNLITAEREVAGKNTSNVARVGEKVYLCKRKL